MGPMKKPAAAVMKKPSGKTDAEPNETMEEEPQEEACEHPEEEDAEDDACVDPDEKLAKKPTKHPFTLKNVKKHDDLMSTRGWSGSELFECFRKMPSSEQQAMWKLFERSRRSSNCDEAYKAMTNGAGSRSKQQKMLRGWMEDGFNVGSSYRQAVLQFEALDKHKVDVNWLSWKQVTDRFGRKEALQRLQNGSLKFRRSPTDEKLESFSHKNTKRRKTEVETKGGKVDKKMLRDMENLAIEDIDADDWKMGEGNLEEALDTMELDKAVKDIVLKKITRATSQQGSASSASDTSSTEDESDKKKKKNKSTRAALDDLEKNSQLADTDGKPEFKHKMASFEKAMTTDLEYFKGLSSSDSNEQLFIDGARKALDKAMKGLAQAKKSLKMEDVKTALMASFDALKKSKTAKTFCQSSCVKRKSSKD
ncbi:unnamed protein product [Symbiodinium sp. CCMP2592]|nr:unnamed protein product [Symbiodinium sp. CCMP2592]